MKLFGEFWRDALFFMMGLGVGHFAGALCVSLAGFPFARGCEMKF